jgi:thiol:disulfide interchange protein
VEDFDVKGVPTVIFLNNKGNDRRALRLVEFMGLAEFACLMEKIK